MHRGRRLRRRHACSAAHAAAQAIDAASGGRLAALVARGDISGKTGRTALLHDLPGVKAPRVLVVGLGDTAKFGVPQYLKAVGDAARALRTGPVKSALFTLSELTVAGPRRRLEHPPGGDRRRARLLSLHRDAGRQEQEARRDRPDAARPSSGDDAHALAQGKAIAAGVAFTRELGNLPPNICNPAYLAQQAQELAGRHDKRRMRRARSRADATRSAWARCSPCRRARPTRRKLIVLKYSNGGDAKPYVLVGKGITFDTGGINLKTQGGIEEMKYDMCGAATVMGTFVSAVGMQLPINLVVIVAAVENMPDGNSYRPSRRAHQHVRQDHRSRQHRRRRPPDPVRRADLRAALRAAGAARRGDADRRLRRRARQVRARA